MQVVAATAMEPPSRGDPATIKDAQVALFRAVAGGRPRPLRPRPVRRATSRSTASPPDSTTETYAALRLDIENWRWSGVPFFIRTGKRLPVDADRGPRSSSSIRRGSASGLAGSPSRTRSSSSSTRRPGIRLILDAHRADAPGATSDRARHGVRAMRAARARRRTRCCSTPRWSATARASRVRTASRRRGGSCSRCSTRRRRCTRTRPDRGGPRRRTSSSPGSAAGTDRGSSHERHEEPGATRGRSTAERCRAVAVPADRRLRVPLRLPHRCARRRPTGRSTGSASPPSTRRASSAACSTGRPGSCASGRTASTIPRRESTSRGRTSS